MRRLFTLVGFVAALVLTVVAPVRAQDASREYIVQIRAGDCGAPGDGIAQLEHVTFSSASPLGAAEAAQGASSYSVAPVAFDALTDSPTAIFVLDAQSHVAVACGEIGGVPGGDGALSIGLRPVEDSGLSGIAYLAPSGSQSGISTFLAMTGANGESGASAVDEPMDESAYSAMVNNQLTVLVGSLRRIDTLFANANASDSNWVSQVRGELFLWKLLYRIAQEVNAPSSFQSFDAQYLDALAQLDSAADDIQQALSTKDQSLLESASTKIQDAVTTLRGLDTSDASGTPAAGTPVS